MHWDVCTELLSYQCFQTKQPPNIKKMQLNELLTVNYVFFKNNKLIVLRLKNKFKVLN